MSSSEIGESLGDAEAASHISGEAPLSRDDIPDKNQKTECFSCGETLTGLFCKNCGQKNDDYRRSIWSLFSEIFTSVFSLENRMWRTWLMLLINPGLVSREFSDGKRMIWASPIRIYLALSIILFGYMSVTETRIFSVRTDIVPKAEFVGEVEGLEDSSVNLSPDFGFFRRQAELDKLNSGTDFERVARLIGGTPRQAFVFNEDLTQLAPLPDNDLLKSSQSWPEEGNESTVDNHRNIALEAYAEKIDDIVDAYNVILFAAKSPETIGKRLVEADELNAPLDISNEIRFGSSEDVKQVTKEALATLDQDLEKLGLTRSHIHNLPVEMTNDFTFNLGGGSINGVQLSNIDVQEVTVQILQNPALLNEGISRYLPRIMFLMMPFAAIIGLIFIRGRKTALLYDHLVHATYIHAVMFAFLFVLILLSQWTPLSGMIQVFFIGIAIYLPLSAKKMFNRGWFKTFFASYSIAILYGLTMFLVLVMLTGKSIVDAAVLGQA